MTPAKPARRCPILGVLVLGFFALPGASLGIPPAERDALLDLYDSTGGPGWTDSTNWNGPPGTECVWYGVFCNGLQSVEILALSGNNLVGTIPATIGQLTSLLTLNILDNTLSGLIPPEIGSLPMLRFLYLGLNQLSGSIPSTLGDLSQLQVLHLGPNQLSGDIPPELGNLTQLQLLLLGSNRLSGQIPPQLGTLSELETLALSSNQLSGSIPSALGDLAQLQALYLDGNQLSGAIPPELGNLSNLQYLVLHSNRLSGSIPVEIANLSNLRLIDLFSNQLTGGIPDEVGNLAGLQAIYLSSNQLSGGIPPSLGDLVQLGVLAASGNQLSGNIPPELGTLSQLVLLSLDDNQLSGSIPSDLGNLVQLEILSLGRNRLAGRVPPEIGNLTCLRLLRLEGNQLSGAVPGELQNLTGLSSNFSDFRYNALSSEDAALIAFLNDKQFGGNWTSFQTVAPTNPATGAATATSLDLSWTPIAYTWDPGGYQVSCATSPGGPYTLVGATADKATPSLMVTGLSPSTTYYCVVRTETGPHAANPNVVISEPSAEVSGATAMATPGITVSPNSDLVTTEAGGTAMFAVVLDSPPAADVTVHFLSTAPGEGTVPESITFTASSWNVHRIVFVTGVDDGLDDGDVAYTIQTSVTSADPIYAAIDPADVAVTNLDDDDASASPDRAALVDLYNSAGGPGWVNSANWNGPPGTECAWYGVLCDGLGNVRELALPQNNLVGTLPASIGQLTSLRTLSLFGNQLSGGIPPQLANLANLQSLALSGNPLSGSIPPELGDLQQLEVLGLSGNQLTGSIPAELGALASLTDLELGSNQLSGNIPAALGNLANLRFLNLASNQLSGEIPASLGDLAQLLLFDLGFNQLSGSIPPELGGLTQVGFFRLALNALSGSIPASLGDLAQVQFLDLTQNHLSGAIPPEIGELVQLQFLGLARNGLSESIPASLGNLSNLFVLDLQGNQLAGEIPGTLQNLINLIDRDPSGFGGLNLHYNALHSDDPALGAFLDTKHAEGPWWSTQTVAPANLAVSAPTETSLQLSWTPIAYTANAGGYAVHSATNPGGPYTQVAFAGPKSRSSVTIGGLSPATTYFFIVRTFTVPHVRNQNLVFSEFSLEVSGATTGNTPAGNDVVVQPVDSTTATRPATLTFASVTQAGSTTLTTSAAGPAPPAGFQLGSPPLYYELSTTAVFNGTVEVCIDYTGTSFADEDQLRLLHFESGVWMDTTASLDTAQDVICGVSSSLSPFLVAERMAVTVRIDIKPGSDLNSISLGSEGTVPVAVFSAADFDATRVDPATVTLAGAPVKVTPQGAFLASQEDVDGDGRADLLVHVLTSALQLTPDATQAILVGRTSEGVRIRGVDSVRVMP